MSRLARVILYSLIVIVLYYVIHEIIRVYQKSVNPAITESSKADSSAVVPDSADTLMADSIISDELITNEDIVGGGEVPDVSDSNTERPKVQNTNDVKPSPAPKMSDASKKSPTASEKPAQKASIPAKSSEKTQSNRSETNPSRPAVKPAPKPKPVKQEPAATISQPGDGGKYLVMAGSYLLRDNATKMVKKLREMGYVHAEVMIFPESEFHSVVAVRYSSETKAQAAVTELKRKGIESFVKVK